MSSTQLAKKALRKQVKQKLAQVSDAVQKSESQLVVQKLLSCEEYRNSQNVSVYLSMPGEVDTQAIVEDIFRQGKNCFVPRWHATKMDMVRLTCLQDYQSLPVNKWNIKEPSHDQPRQVAMESDELPLHLIIVPGLAFDKQGWRLGHGKGYYDSFITECTQWSEERGMKRPWTVALSLSAQIVDQVPRESHDVKPDVLFTP